MLRTRWQNSSSSSLKKIGRKGYLQENTRKNKCLGLGSTGNRPVTRIWVQVAYVGGDTREHLVDRKRREES